MMQRLPPPSRDSTKYFLLPLVVSAVPPAPAQHQTFVSPRSTESRNAPNVPLPVALVSLMRGERGDAGETEGEDWKSSLLASRGEAGELTLARRLPTLLDLCPLP